LSGLGWLAFLVVVAFLFPQQCGNERYFISASSHSLYYMAFWLNCYPRSPSSSLGMHTEFAFWILTLGFVGLVWSMHSQRDVGNEWKIISFIYQFEIIIYQILLE